MWYFKTFIIVLGVIVGVSAAALAIKVALFPLKVAYTVTNTAEDVADKTLSADNVLTNYEWFFDVNARYDSRVRQIVAHEGLILKTTDTEEKSRLNIELSAMQQSCRDLATKYNANSSKLNKKLFKDNNLPSTLSMSKCEV